MLMDGIADLDLRGSRGLPRWAAGATRGIDADENHQLSGLIGYLDLSASFPNIPRQFGNLRPHCSWMAENDGLDCRDCLVPIEHVEIVGGHSSPRANLDLQLTVKRVIRGFGSMASKNFVDPVRRRGECDTHFGSR
jgi:hypothetical protein